MEEGELLPEEMIMEQVVSSLKVKSESEKMTSISTNPDVFYDIYASDKKLKNSKKRNEASKERDKKITGNNESKSNPLHKTDAENRLSKLETLMSENVGGWENGGVKFMP